MDLNSFIQIPTVFQPKTKVFPEKTTPVAPPGFSDKNIPLIFQKLQGQVDENLEFLAKSKTLPDKNFQELNKQIGSILIKMSGLASKNFQEESSFISKEIALLESQVKKLETLSDQYKNEGLLVSKETHFLKKITKEFHEVCLSMEDWLIFQERYLFVDEQLSSSLEVVQSSIFSDLKGWSLTAFEEIAKSADLMITLIKITTPVLEQPGVFNPEILEMLKNSSHAISWHFNDWFHEVFTHFENVASIAGRQWEQACQQLESGQSLSLEAYSQLLLAAEQLLAMKQTLEQMEKTLSLFPDFKSISNSLGKIKGTIEIKQSIIRDLSALDEMINDAKTDAPPKLDHLKGIITDYKIHSTIARANKAITQIDGAVFSASIRKIQNDYEKSERTLDRYIHAKQQLYGALTNPQVMKFCQAEEAFFNQHEASPINFNELTRAKLIELGQPEPGMFSRIYKALAPDPAGWSDQTKQWIHTGFIALQLIDQISKMVPSQPVSQKETPTLTKEQQEKIDEEAAFLGTVLDKGHKINYLRKNPLEIQHFTKKFHEVRPILEELIKHPTNLSDKQIMDGYRSYRQEALLTGKSNDNFEWLINTATQIPPSPPASINPSPVLADKITEPAPLAKTEAVSLPNLKGSGTVLKSFSAEFSAPINDFKKEITDELYEAVKTAKSINSRLQECSRIDFLKPKEPTSPHLLIALRDETALLQRSLSETMINRPLDRSMPEWMAWSQSVQKQCYSLKQLEKRVADAMSAYEEELAIRNYNNYFALDVYGNKHKNLVKQADIVAAIGISGLEVPMPQGISSFTVLKFLQAYAPEIFEHWNQVRELYANNQEKGPILENDTILSHLKAIDQGIENAFLKASNDTAAFDQLGFNEKTKEWLAGLIKENIYLMVRSTGAEDSKASANAGGNASISYVKPTQKELSIALGEVVRSYFSVGSLQKRLNANLNPFEDELRVAVTAQKLIGEEIGGAKDPGQIPVSIVLFSSEPLYIGNEKFRAMRISATYGHGEGVVGNEGIATDTALLLISTSDPGKLYILYDNQEKPERLAPVLDPETQKVTLGKIKNNAEMANRPALNDALITRLYEWGVIAEKYFDYPTDMEIVIKGDTIYPVQARPINRPPLSASYVDFKKISKLSSTPVEKTLKTELIVPGKASVVEITKPEEVCIAATLKKAEKLFKKGQHKLVIVGQQEPANSHPVVNFSALGMPCLFASNLKEAQDLLKKLNPTHHLAGCVQSGALSLWDTTKGAVKDYTAEGFVVHPAKIAISLPVKSSIPKLAGVVSKIPEEITDLLLKLRTATTNEAALEELNALKQEKWITGLQTKIDTLKEKVVKQPLFGRSANPIIKSAEALQSKIEESFSHIEILLKQPQDTGKLELLIHIKILETLLFQQPTSPGALTQHSILSMEKSFKAADALMLYQSQLQHPAHFADILMDGSQSPINEVFDEWNAFLLKLEPLAEKTYIDKATGFKAFIQPLLKSFFGDENSLTTSEISGFRTLLHTLRKAEVLPFFMTFYMGQIDTTDPVAALRQVITLMPPQEEPLIEQVLIKQKEIRQLANDIGRIGDPKAYPVLLERLEKAVEDFLPTDQNWLQTQNWQKTSPITRSIAIQSMNELVDLYDTAIKTMKASPEIKSDIEKTQKFKQMLYPYFKLLKELSTNTVGKENYLLHTDWPLHRYLIAVQSLLGNLPGTDPGQLNPSPDFSVSASALGSGTDFSFHKPGKLEDVFTWIHQSLLFSTGALTNQLLSKNEIQKSSLPANLKMALDYCETASIGIAKSQKTGIEIDKAGITFHYNIPLRSHSSKLSIYYDRESGKLQLNVQFFGKNEHNRWDLAAERAVILNAAGILPLQSTPEVTPQELILSWDITDIDNLKHAFEECSKVSTLSFEVSFGAFFYPLEPSLDNFIRDVINKGKFSDAPLLFFKENPPKTTYGKALLNAYIQKIDNPIEIGLNDPHLYSLFSLFAKEGFKDQAPYIREKAFELWDKMLALNKGIPEAIEAARKVFKTDRMTRTFVFELWDKILALNQGIPEAIDTAKEGLKDKNAYVHKEALEFFGKIIALNQGIPEAIDAAKEGFKDNDGYVQEVAFELFDKILALNQGIPEAIDAAKEGVMTNGYKYVHAMKLWDKIFTLDKGIPEAIDAAKEMITHNKYEMRHHGLNLWHKILAFGRGYREAIDVATKEIENSNASMRWIAISLLIKLVDLNQGVPEAISAAKNGIKDEDLFDYPLDLWKKLIQFPEGRHAAQEFLAHEQSSDNPNYLQKLNKLKTFLD